MALAEYKKKREFNTTPEPAGKLHKAEEYLRFVVQKHHASQLHYDFRLELDGVLKSWAVPKGPSLNPDDKRLAMMVEDHPYDYRDFEGVIPKGNYGAGKVIVWDEGTYEDYEQSGDLKTQIKNLRAGLKEGDFKFRLHGQKLNGAYVLAKMHNDDNAWLLIKKKDEFATDEDVTKQAESVKSGLDVEQVGDTPGKKWLKAPKLNLKGAPKAKQPAKLEPMLATLSKEAFDDPDWLYEIKWDGYRILAHLEGGEIKLLSRNGKDYTEVFAPIAEELKSLKVDGILDGEVVVLDQDGKSDFGGLQNYQRTGEGHLVYEVFDAPYAGGHDLRELPLTKRKEVVQTIIKDLGNVRYSDHIEGDGKAFFAQAEKLGLEGVMAKQKDSEYLVGKRGKRWLKIKTHMRQEVVIGGWTEPRGSRKGIGALVMGVYDGKKLRYVGNVGGGLNEKNIAQLLDKLKPLERKSSPFDGVVKNDTPIHWVKPELLAEVKFAEWTGDGHLRQPIFIGLREDKEAQKVHKEEAMEPTDGKFTPTHRDKVFWPKEKYTKGDVIDYYNAVSDIILPHITDRPESMNRHPNGIKGANFFQKDVESHPAWVKTHPIYSESNDKDINWLICSDRDTLLYMANLGCIELNPWHSRVGSLDKPDYCLIDLDAKTATFEDIIETAKTCKQVLDQIGADSFVKTSGKTGLHILLPLGAKYTYEQSKQFAQLLVGEVNKRLPKLTSVERNPDKRKGKVYLDFLQNRKGQTMAVAYCLRPVEGAPVSTPLKWSEVKKGLDPKKFNIKTMPARIKKVGDLHKDLAAHKGIDMIKCLEKLEEL